MYMASSPRTFSIQTYHTTMAVALEHTKKRQPRHMPLLVCGTQH